MADKESVAIQVYRMEGDEFIPAVKRRSECFVTLAGIFA